MSLKKVTAVLMLMAMLATMVACAPNITTTAPDNTTAPDSTTAPSNATVPDNTTHPGNTTIPDNTAAPTQPTEPPVKKTLVVIDAGHQAKANLNKEPLGPGSSEMKIKVAGGATGVVTGLEEYKLTLMVALKLQAELEKRGYQVMMIRTTHDVDLSNAERAQIANAANADAFIRIHGNSYDDPSVHGALTMCQSKKNPFNGSLYAQCRSLSEAVLDGLVAATGCKKRAILESDTMSGINWCQTPVTIVEMGFMSNPEEDRLMATDAYQTQIAVGIANGLDTYFGRST